MWESGKAIELLIVFLEKVVAI